MTIEPIPSFKGMFLSCIGLCCFSGILTSNWRYHLIFIAAYELEGNSDHGSDNASDTVIEFSNMFEKNIPGLLGISYIIIDRNQQH
jgi:hypothetical protein